MPSRKRQATLFEFASSSPAKRSSPYKASERIIEITSEDGSDSDPGRIQFERDVIEVQDSDQEQSEPEEAGKSTGPIRRSACIKTARKSSPMISAGSSNSASENQVAPKKRSGRGKRLSHHIINSDESEGQEPRKKRRLVKGKRPETPPIADEDEDEDLIEEVDEERILDSRFRDRSKKSVFTRNLERLQRRRRGQMSASDSENEEDNSEPSSPARAGTSRLFRGAHPTANALDDDHELEEDASVNEDEDGDGDGFIVEDEGGEEMPELPTMFSMGTFQDLSHHFKVICQLFVHLAVKQPHKRRSFMKAEMKKNYFSVPLAIARRKLSAMKDSLVASSIWKADLKNPLETFPDFRLEHLDFSIPLCDACHLGNRVATLRGVVTGQRYDQLTFEPLQEPNGEIVKEGVNQADWNLGRFCAARAQVFHTFTHWEYILYHSLHMEVDLLRAASTQSDGRERRVFLPATNGASPPDDLDDADGIMDWLDGRGIINERWMRLREMMDRAHKLESKGKDAEDDIDIMIS